MSKATPPLIVPAELDDAGLSVYVFRVLCHISRRAGKDGWYYGGGSASAATCRMGRRQWFRSVSELVKLGYLEMGEKRMGMPTSYRVLWGTSSAEEPVPVRPTTVSSGELDRVLSGTDRVPTGPHKRRSPFKESPKESLEGTADASRPVSVQTVLIPENDDNANNGASTTTTTSTALVVVGEVLEPGAWPANWNVKLVDALAAAGHEFGIPEMGRALKRLKGRYAFDAVENGLLAWAEEKAGFGLYCFMREAGRWINGTGKSPRTREDRNAGVLMEFQARLGR